MLGFLLKLTQLPRNLSIIEVTQCNYKYVKYLIRYQHLNEIILNARFRMIIKNIFAYFSSRKCI